MDNAFYHARITVHTNPATAFNAITNVRGWWSQEIEGATDTLGEVFFYHYKDVHLCKLQLVELVPQEKVVYQVLENEFNFVESKTEWLNSQLIFTLEPLEDRTDILFTHKGLSPDCECYGVCEDAWNGYIRGSLQQLIDTGTGRPNAKEGGLNAELVAKWGLPNK